MAEEEDLSLRVDFPFQRNLSPLGGLIHRDLVETFSRRVPVDDRIEILLQILPREILQLRFRRTGGVFDKPRNAEKEAAFTRNDGHPLTRARLAVALEAHDLSGHVHRKLVLQADARVLHLFTAARKALADEFLGAVAELRRGDVICDYNACKGGRENSECEIFHGQVK